MVSSRIKKRPLATWAAALAILVVLLVILVGSSAGAQPLPSVQVHGLWPVPAQFTTDGTIADAVPGEVLVSFAAGTDRRHVDAHADLAESAVARDLTPSNTSVLRPSLYLVKSGSRSTAQLIDAFSRDSNVVQISPNYRIHIHDVLPNDPLFPQMWGLSNTGQTGGTAGADIHAPQAWQVSTGSSTVVVADVDTGISYTHPDLAANVWTNPGEIPNNGIDDDGNGYVDDVYGIGALNGGSITTNPMDDNGHGTHTAGTIGAVGDNGVGVTGVAWNVKVMGLKFLDSSGSGYLSDAITCINYATYMKLHGVNIVAINASWGGAGSSSALKTAIDAAGAAGIIFCASAGNSGINNDTSSSRSYPASYTSSNLIAVAATDSSDRLASWSNYGATSVDLAAPGVSILSTVLNNGYALYSGTSMAAPHVSGAVAVLAAAYPADTVAQRIQRILSKVDKLTALTGKVATGGRLNLANALGTPPVTYTVAASVTAGSGTALPLTQTVVSGGTAVVTITPATGYMIGTVMDGATNVTAQVSAGKYTITNVTASHTVTVSFVAAPTYTVTASVTAGSGTALPLTQTVVSGGSAVVTITPATGYMIGTVMDGATNVTAQVSAGKYTITNVTANHAVTVSFKLTPVSSVTRYEENDSRLLYTGTWSVSNVSSASAGSYRFTNSSGRSVKIAFNGTGINWIATKSRSMGRARVSVDGGSSFYVDLYSSSTRYNVSAWSVSGLAPADHTVLIQWTGTRNRNASSTTISIDAVDVTGALIQAN